MNTGNAQTLPPKGRNGTAVRHGDVAFGRPEKMHIDNGVDVPDDYYAAYEKPCDVFRNEDGQTFISALAQSFAPLKRGLEVILLFAVALIGLLICKEGADFWMSLSGMPLPEKCLFGIPAAACLLIILYFALKIWQLFLTLRRQSETSLLSVAEFDTRRDIRKLDHADHKTFFGHLSEALKDNYGGKYASRLAELGVPDENVKELMRARRSLLDGDAKTSREWIDEFKGEFQTRMDAIAAEHINRSAIRTAILMTVSPYCLLDKLIGISSGLKLVKDLFTIYDATPPKGAGFLLLGKVFVVTYLSGNIEGIINGLNGLSASSFQAEHAASQLDAADMMTDRLSEIDPETPWRSLLDGLTPRFASGGKKLFGKLAEAGIQYLIFKRIGRTVMNSLRLADVKEA